MPDESFDAQRRKLAEVAASLDAKARELMSRQASLERREAELGPREASLAERERQLRQLGEQLGAIRQELIARARAMVQREEELGRRESELAERERRLEEQGRELARLREDYEAHRRRVGELEVSLAAAENELRELKSRAGEAALGADAAGLEAARRAEEARAIFETKAAELAGLAQELKNREEELRARESGSAGTGVAKMADAAGPPSWLPSVLADDWSRPQPEAAPSHPATQEETPAEPMSSEPQMMELPPPVPLEVMEAPTWPTAPEGPLPTPPPPAWPAELREGAPEGTGRAAVLSEGEVRDLLARADRAILEARIAGGDVVAASQLLSRAQELLQERMYGEATEAGRKSIALARAALESVEARRRAQAVESARKVVEDVKQLGVQVAEAEQLLEKAIRALENAEHGLAEKYALEAETRARQSGEGFSRASESLRSLDTIMRESQRKQAELDLGEVERIKQEAQAAFDGGDYNRAFELARRAERRLHELELAVQQRMGAPGTPSGGAAPGAPSPQAPSKPQKYRCPSCGKPFQVTPPAKRPFNVACPWCASTVRISR
ncbi:MAG: hypothetical protein QW379_10085 [Thermoplasmata archaeon]